MMKDRVSAGFIGGIIAGIAMNVVDYFLHFIKFDLEHLYDWAAVALYGRVSNTLFESIFAQIGQLFFAGLLGIIFSIFLLKLTSGNYLLKGWLYGITTWFFLYAMAIALKLPSLENHSLNSVFSHFLSASVYGLVLPAVLHRINNNSKRII